MLENKEYKIIIGRIEDSYETYVYLCDIEDINVGDFVNVEEKSEKIKVLEIQYVEKESSRYPISELKKVTNKFIEPTIKENNDNEQKTEVQEETNNDNTNKKEKIIENLKKKLKYKKQDNIELEERLEIVSFVNPEFSYVDHHADCLMKIKDDLYTTDYSLIQEIVIANITSYEYSNLLLKFSFSSEIFNMNDVHIIKLGTCEILEIRIPFLKVNKALLEKLTENDTATVEIQLIDQEDGKTIASSEERFIVHPICEPSINIHNDYRLYAKYITPVDSRVKQIALNATKFNNNEEIIAYQHVGKDRYNKMLEEAQAIYLALHDWGIVYQNPPAGGLVTQRVRMPGEVLNDKKGTCLDLAILYCACMQEVGYNSILVLIDNHAFAGFFLDDKLNFPNAVEYQCGKVYNQATGGMDKLVLVECTMFTAAKEASFKDAMDEGLLNIKMYNGRSFSAIDVKLAHKGIFTPIPTIGVDDELELLIKPKEIENKNLDSIVETIYKDVLRETEKDRFTFWERRLLDLTEANPLVNFHLRTSNCLKMTSDSKIYELLLNNQGAIKFATFPLENSNVTSKTLENEFMLGSAKPFEIFGDEFGSDKMLAIGYDQTLKNLIKKSNSAMDETGAPTLYLCLGLLTYNRKKGHLKGNAPFMVLPIKITKDKMNYNYTMHYDYDDIMINQTFFEYYKQEHPDIDFSELYQINSNDNYMDIVHTFKANNIEDIQLDEEAFFIANLTFAHYIMWLDVRKRKEELKKNVVIQSILENKNLLTDNVTTFDDSIDKLEKYKDFAAPLYYDSTQLKAILKCGEGKSFILDGPPGTGKSQTIVNMIVNAFYQGKTVLFVAEKKAALDVVADRLKKLGDPNSNNNLGRFCLELHSNKANKVEFFEKLKSSMELGVTKNPEEFEQKCQELEAKRDKVLQTINKMHENKYYYSLYDAIVKQAELSYLDYNSEFDEEFLLSLNDEKNREIYSLIETYISSASNMQDFNNTPLKTLKIENINFYDRANVIESFSNVKTLLFDFIKSYKEMVANFDIEFDFEHNEVATVMSTIDLCLNHKLYIETLTEFMSNQNDDKNQKVFDKAHKIVTIKNTNKDVFNFDLLSEVDAEAAINEINNATGFIKKILVKGRLKKLLKKYVLETHKINKKDLSSYFEQIKEYNSLIKEIQEQSTTLSKMINFSFSENIEDVKNIEKTYYNTRSFLNNLNILSENKDFIKVSNLFINLYATKNPAIKMMYTINANKLTTYKEEEIKLTEKYKIKYSNFNGLSDNINKFIDLLEYTSYENNFNELIDIANVNRIAKELVKLNLNKLVDAIEQDKFDFNDFKEVYDLSCVNGYIRMYFKDDEINYFNPTVFESEVRKYKDLINEYNNLVIECVSARLTKNLNHSNINYANSSPIGRLKKSISSNGRGVTIRDTLLNYDDIIKKYFPCFLMSPLSAAQYLAVDEEKGKSVSKFDLVIFDEASQIPTHEAVGPIARGKSLIVAGDPEQMPPSAYFSAGLELAEDEVQFDDAISLLDECIAIELPRIRLAYHYRSKHESLISFSNHNFYNDTLYTFPSPNTANSFVEYNHVELKEDKKNSNITEEEIKAICDKFTEIYTNEKTMKKSVGIIVFNMKQQEKVFDAITELLANNKKLNKVVEEAFDKTGEAWFVKSLENVQGDERDIIILSVGFRKNAAGRAVVVGPLARENGQRRLNVAVSRSKERMIVISTIKYTDFEEDSKISNKGKLLLKQFLKFAEENTFKPFKDESAEKGTIISFIKKDLETRGLTVVSNVGNSDFRVDLAIKNKTGDFYELGILIDSQVLGEEISCRDKIYVQESVLNALKWKIVNIYSLEYFKDRKATIDKIVDAMSEPYVREEYQIDAHIEKAVVPVFSYNSTNYIKVQTRICVDYDNDYGFDREIQKLLSEIILTESPVSFETIKMRVREHSNIQSMSAKAKNRLQSALRVFNEYSTLDQSQTVYWSQNQSKDMSVFRTNSDRDLNDIPKEEILCAMNQIIRVQGRLSQEDLFRCTLEAFNYGQAVLSKKNYERLEYVYRWATSHGKLI